VLYFVTGAPRNEVDKIRLTRTMAFEFKLSTIRVAEASLHQTEY